MPSTISQKGNKGLVQALAIILILCIVAYVLSRVFKKSGRHDNPGASGNEIEQATTAKLLHAANATIYGSERCGYTVRQMERFGRSVHLIDYVECGSGNEKCSSIEGFPTWKIGEHVLMGDQPLSALRSAAERALNAGSRGGAHPSVAVPAQQEVIGEDASVVAAASEFELEPVSCETHHQLGNAY